MKCRCTIEVIDGAGDVESSASSLESDDNDILAIAFSVTDALSRCGAVVNLPALLIAVIVLDFALTNVGIYEGSHYEMELSEALVAAANAIIDHHWPPPVDPASPAR